ncbi:small ubiquitin-related modifier 2-A-like [Vombatus ursinus]|uniref:small ubiquitin-related modifier 2-A-like n=1 Tax=Vombatus ursinus TaxID=29139 RepID=UPI000FFCFF7F|nr:small ubiquitin-related modifier 2-A-like [Vombatus ursinus]
MGVASQNDGCRHWAGSIAIPQALELESWAISIRVRGEIVVKLVVVVVLLALYMLSSIILGLKEDINTKNSNRINLKVAGQDGLVVQFKIKRRTPLSKLMKASCERQGLSMRQIRFRFDGQPINETDTPAGLEMEDEHAIDVFQQQTGGPY